MPIDDLGPPRDARMQCMNHGCGTMLLDDGTCPRCSPPAMRSTADKLALAERYQDGKLKRLAHAEIEAGIATGLDAAGVEEHDAPEHPRRKHR